MSLIADALQPHITNGLITLSGRSPEITLPDLITSQRGVGFHLGFDAVDQSIFIDFGDTELIARAIAADACRLSSAAFQSIVPAANSMGDRDAIAWCIIKLYYAAFYAGHAVIRILGESCSYFDRTHTVRIATIAQAIGTSSPFQLESGLYRCAVTVGSTEIKCSRVRGASGGAHEAFWGVFQRRIHDLMVQVLHGPLPPADAQRVFSQLEAAELLVSGIAPHTQSKLSLFRNDVQYRQRFGLWFPVRLRSAQRQSLGRLAAQWLRDPMNVDIAIKGSDPLLEFVSACTFIVSLCRALLSRIAERSSAGPQCFVNFGPMSFLRNIGLES